MNKDLPIKIKLPEDFLDEEVRMDFKIESNVKELWAVELDLLQELDCICKKNKITYYVATGTLLGTVRHEGFIPWDDDIDVMMFRDEYDKLCKISNQFKKPYFLQTEFTDRGTTRGHAQLRNSETTGILRDEQFSKLKFNQGIFIDIFVIDNYPDDRKLQRKINSRMIRTKKVLNKFRVFNINNDEKQKNNKRILKALLYPFVFLLRNIVHVEHFVYILYEKNMKKYNDRDTKKVCMMCFLDTGNRVVWDRKDFGEDVVYKKFEFMEVPVPSGYRHILSKLYGQWEKIVRAESSHGDIIIDTRTSYKKYIK